MDFWIGASRVLENSSSVGGSGPPSLQSSHPDPKIQKDYTDSHSLSLVMTVLQTKYSE